MMKKTRKYLWALKCGSVKTVNSIQKTVHRVGARVITVSLFASKTSGCISYNTHRLNGRNTARYGINMWLNGRKREELGAAFDPLVMKIYSGELE